MRTDGIPRNGIHTLERDQVHVSRGELRQAVIRAKEGGELTEELAGMALAIVRGYLSRERFNGYSLQDREDIIGAWAVQFVKNWDRLDLEKNLHSYITTMAANAYRMFERGRSRRQRKIEAKGESLQNAVRDRREDWGRAICHLRFEDHDEGIVAESVWLARVCGTVSVCG